MPRKLPLEAALGSLAVTLAAAVMTAAAAAQELAAPPLFFEEMFEDDALLERGWYDGSTFDIGDERPHTGDGCIEFRWKDRGTTPDNSRGARHLFEASDTAYMRFAVRLSSGWGWSGRNYHPHLMLFMTSENGAWDGPAATHLTVYVEPCAGKLRLAAQDIQNAESPHGLTQGPLRGGYNGRLYDSAEVLFDDDQWHVVEAEFRLNSLDTAADRPNPDGVVRGWFDGELVVEATDVVLRSTDFPEMQFNQFLMLPYFGPGLLPHAQTMWIDDLDVGATRPEPSE